MIGQPQTFSILSINEWGSQHCAEPPHSNLVDVQGLPPKPDAHSLTQDNVSRASQTTTTGGSRPIEVARRGACLPEWTGVRLDVATSRQACRRNVDNRKHKGHLLVKRNFINAQVSI